MVTIKADKDNINGGIHMFAPEDAKLSSASLNRILPSQWFQEMKARYKAQNK